LTIRTGRRGDISTSHRALVAICCAAIVACGESDTSRSGSAAIDSPSPGTGRTFTANRVAGIPFDPTAVHSGDRIGALTLESIEVRAAYDSTRVGTARFSGQLELSGWTVRHPEADLRDRDLCFEADSTSAARLPRWRGDERRAWFCFGNQADAKRMLGPPSDSTWATIIIDRFNIHRGLSDEVNSARLAVVLGQ